MLGVALYGLVLLVAGLLIAGTTHNSRSALIPIGTIVSLAGLACLLIGGTTYVVMRRASRHAVQIFQLPPPGVPRSGGRDTLVRRQSMVDLHRTTIATRATLSLEARFDRRSMRERCRIGGTL
jgi:hypothetical protein